MEEIQKGAIIIYPGMPWGFIVVPQFLANKAEEFGLYRKINHPKFGESYEKIETTHLENNS